MKLFKVKIKGTTALMHHRFTEEALFGLLGPKTKKKKSEEPRTPREIAESHAYKGTDGSFYIPTEMVGGAFALAASEYKLSSTSRKSLKTVAKAAFRPTQETATLKNDGQPIKDFEVDVRRATNHKVGAVAVCRPRFDRWEAEFDVQIDTDISPDKTALEILQEAGKKSGIGSFRVSKGGFFGQFNVIEWKEITT